MGEKAKVTAKKPAMKKSKSLQAPKTELNSPIGSPIDQILFLQRTIGNQAVQRLFKSGVIQAKLKIGQPNDIYEQEADRVAELVLRMPEPRVQRQTEEEEKEQLVQMKPISEQITPLVQRQVEPEEEEEEELLQTKSNGQTPQVALNPESKINSLKGGGQPLDKSTRNFFEPRFGQDFSGVRVHTYSNANQLARDINAKAFTRENDIVFGSGQYTPETFSGKRLMGHELTHVVQQKRNQVWHKLTFTQPENRYKDESEQAVRAAMQQEKQLMLMKAEPESVCRQTREGERAGAPKTPRELRQVYNLELCGDKYENLTIEQVDFVVRDIAKRLRNWSEAERDAHDYLKKLHDDNPWVAGFANFIGRVSMPPIERWSGPRGPLSNLKVVESLLDAGEPILAADIVVAAEIGYHDCHDRLYEYRRGTIKGAERSLTGLKVTVVAGQIAATVATGGAAAKFVLLAKAGAIGLGGGAYAAYKELVTQSSEQVLGLRGEFDWKAIWRVSADEAIAYFVGGLVGGALANKFYKWCSNYIKALAPIDKEINAILRELRQLGVKGVPQYLTKTDLIPLWQKYGIEYLSAMGSKALKEPAKIVLEDLRAKGEFPTVDELVEKVGLQFWATRATIETFIRFLAVTMPLHR